MKALVIGYGSIGARHAQVLTELGLEVAVVSRRNVAVERLYPDIAPALSGFGPDYVVLASRTNEHAQDLETLAASGFAGRVLVEKPLFETDRPVPDNRFASLHIAYNLRFHPVVAGLREALADRTLHAAHAYVGQYLPDWRPAADYRDSYSAHAALGGGVLRDLSHEIDFLYWLCGAWRRVTAIGGHFSGLEIDSDDVFSILAESARCPAVSIHMNYLDTRLRREVVVLTDRGTCRADLARCTLEVDGEETTFPLERNDTYLAQHAALLQRNDGIDMLCTAQDGAATMQMIAAVERAAADGAWVAP